MNVYPSVREGDRYQHFRGQCYTVVGSGTGWCDRQKKIILRDESGGLWDCLLIDFHGQVTYLDENKQIKKSPRFALLISGQLDK